MKRYMVVSQVNQKRALKRRAQGQPVCFRNIVNGKFVKGNKRENFTIEFYG